MRFFILLSLSFILMGCIANKAGAQIYFNLPADEVKTKAARNGFEFSRTEALSGDSLNLFFIKTTDANNQLTCYLNSSGLCYQFSYTLPASSVVAFHKNLSKNFVKRNSGIWESREKNFLLRVDNTAGITTVIYLPYEEE